jgi:hypothetical protein
VQQGQGLQHDSLIRAVLLACPAGLGDTQPQRQRVHLPVDLKQGSLLTALTNLCSTSLSPWLKCSELLMGRLRKHNHSLHDAGSRLRSRTAHHLLLSVSAVEACEAGGLDTCLALLAGDVGSLAQHSREPGHLLLFSSPLEFRTVAVAGRAPRVVQVARGRSAWSVCPTPCFCRPLSFANLCCLLPGWVLADRQ